MGALGTLTQVPIDYYAKVDLGGFVRVVDVLGGVDVNVAHGFCDPGYDEYGFTNGFSITAGLHHLNGQQALAYARVRKASGESDFTRAARQQEVISGIRDSIVHGGFLNDPIGLLQALGKTVETNVPRDLLPGPRRPGDAGRARADVPGGRDPPAGRLGVRRPRFDPDPGRAGDPGARRQPLPDGRLASVGRLRAAEAVRDRGVSGSGVGGCNPAPKPKPTPTPEADPDAERPRRATASPSGSPIPSGEPSGGVAAGRAAGGRPRPEVPPDRRFGPATARVPGQPEPASLAGSSVSWSHSTRKASWPLVDRISR